MMDNSWKELETAPEGFVVRPGTRLRYVVQPGGGRMYPPHELEWTVRYVKSAVSGPAYFCEVYAEYNGKVFTEYGYVYKECLPW